MKVIWSPTGGERREWDWDPDSTTCLEAEAIEEVGGPSWDTFTEFWAAFEKGSVKAQRAALWVLRRRDDPALRFADCLFTLSELEVTWDQRQIEALRKQILAEEMDEDRRAELLGMLGFAGPETVDPKAEPSTSLPGPETSLVAAAVTGG